MPSPSLCRTSELPDDPASSPSLVGTLAVDLPARVAERQTRWTEDSPWVWRAVPTGAGRLPESFDSSPPHPHTMTFFLQPIRPLLLNFPHTTRPGSEVCTPQIVT
jgi:hypothetical protein